jgi:hypothetical protein
MITLRTTRHQVAAFVGECFPYIDRWKLTNQLNAAGTGKIDDTYLVATMTNCVMGEVQTLFTKKYNRSKSVNLKFELTDAQAVILYKTLLFLPIPSSNVFLLTFRANWIEQLDKGLIQDQILKKPEQVSTTSNATAWFGDEG